MYSIDLDIDIVLLNSMNCSIIAERADLVPQTYV